MLVSDLFSLQRLAVIERDGKMVMKNEYVCILKMTLMWFRELHNSPGDIK